MLRKACISRGSRKMQSPRGGAHRTLARRLRTALRMHAILFALKRTFHKSVWFGRFLLKDYCLTPSRFDILYILKKQPVLRTMWQSKIREILGIAGPTLSRMIKALVELGFIRRERSTLDRRQFEISLTGRGRQTITHAIRTIIDSGIITHAVVHFVSPDWESPEATFRDVDELEVKLKYMRERLLDEATLNYLWHPDDLFDRWPIALRPLSSPLPSAPPPG